MIDINDSIIIMLNYDDDFFKNTFSKMEFLMGMDYMNKLIKKFDLPVIFTKRELNYKIKNNDIMKAKNKKENKRIKNRPPESSYDGKFLEQFKNKTEIKNQINVKKEDIFYNTDIENYIKEFHKNTLLFGGFFTDTDIFISSIEANLREFNAIVVSDITSTYSERLYFQSLEMISQFVDVIDTRDFMSMYDI